MYKILFVIACFSCGIMSASAEQIRIRPGLWEVITTSDLLALVPHIPSEQMRQITELAKRYGLIMPEIRNNAATSKVCITPDMAAQDIPTYFYDGQSGCSIENAFRTGNRFQITISCDNAQFQGNGTAEGVLTSPEQFSGKTEFDSWMMDTPIHATAETNAHWIGETCSVQPTQPERPAYPGKSNAPPEFIPLK